MVDIPLPPIGASRKRRWHIRRYLFAAAILMLIALNLSAVVTQFRERKCDSPLGKLAVSLKMDLYYSRCHCMKPALDFSDPCNSMYLPVLL